MNRIESVLLSAMLAGHLTADELRKALTDIGSNLDTGANDNVNVSTARNVTTGKINAIVERVRARKTDARETKIYFPTRKLTPHVLDALSPTRRAVAAVVLRKPGIGHHAISRMAKMEPKAAESPIYQLCAGGYVVSKPKP